MRIHEKALEAIKARINGDYGNIFLVAFGPLTENCNADILSIIEIVEKGTK